MWRRYCEFKVAYHGAVALLYQGMQAEEQQKMGERLAYYQAAVDALNEASKLSKNLEQQEVRNAFDFDTGGLNFMFYSGVALTQIIASQICVNILRTFVS